MQPAGGCENGGPSRSLTRFRSAPATWLEALLESDEERPDVVLELPEPLPEAGSDLDFLESSSGGGSSSFLRQNSSPAEFLSLLTSSDGCFSSSGVTASYEFPSLPSAKRDRPLKDSNILAPKLSSSSVSTLDEAKCRREMVGSLDSEMENLLESSIICRARAKRGCATHPRSIAERVRRTRISDRIRKLQELVPDMEKQTNTADMLEEAVSYVKFLQK